MSGTTPPAEQELSRALVAVARAIADSLDIQEVWTRITEACGVVVPFDGMGVARLEGEYVRLVAIGRSPR